MAAAVRGAAAGTRVAYLDTSNAVTRRRLMQLHAALPQVAEAPYSRKSRVKLNARWPCRVLDPDQTAR